MLCKNSILYSAPVLIRSSQADSIHTTIFPLFGLQGHLCQSGKTKQTKHVTFNFDTLLK